MVMIIAKNISASSKTVNKGVPLLLGDGAGLSVDLGLGIACVVGVGVGPVE